jgi:hypothetical protein
MKQAIVVLLLTFIQLPVSAQEKQFRISVAGFDIGDLKISRSECDGYERYELRSKVKLWLLFRIEVDYNLVAIYEDGKLVSSESKTYSNKGNFSSTTRWNGTYYEVHIDAYQYKKDTAIHEPIEFDIAKMYFEMPDEGQKIYADNFGVLCEAERSADQVEVRILGNKSTYNYRDRVLSYARMYNPIKDYRVTFLSER